MNLETILVRPSDAAEKIDAYKRALRRRADKEYEHILRAYEKVRRGTQVIQLTRAIARGGWDEQGRPRLAVARADKTRVSFHLRFNDLLFNCSGRSPWQRAGMLLQHRTPLSMMADRPRGREGLSAMVPLVPPDARKGRDMSKRLVLFEADWEEPPVDPALLLPLGGDLYAVEAVWDLTDLERAVIAGTRGRVA